MIEKKSNKKNYIDAINKQWNKKNTIIIYIKNNC